MQKVIFFLLFAAFFISCKNDTTSHTAKKYKVTPFKPSTAFDDAQIASMTYRDGMFKFGVVSDTYELGEQTPDAPQKMCANSGKGQHIHLIVDNAPYAAKYVDSFEYAIDDGEHYLLAFLSRSYHESIKTPTAHVAQKITVKDGAIEGSDPVTTPMLFYSRPKGTYTGKAETEKVMLDFYPVKARIGEDFKAEKRKSTARNMYWISGSRTTLKDCLLERIQLS